MAFVAPIHKASSIRHALRIRIISPDIEDLVIAKANRLEIWRVDGPGLVRLYTKLIHGSITMLQRLQPKGFATDLLFIGTQRFQYFNVAWNPETNHLETVDEPIEDISEPYMRPSQSQNKCLVDPSGRFLAMHLWEGVLNVFRLPTRKGSSTKLEVLDQVRLTELWMKSSTFLHSRTGHPRIAFLYKTQLDREDARLAIYRLTKDDKGGEVSRFDPYRDRELDVVIPDPYSSLLIPVPVDEEKRYHVRNSEGAKAHLGGVLVLGETHLKYFDTLTYTSVQSLLEEPRIFVAWAEYTPTQYFVADDYGRLDLLTIETAMEFTGVVVTGMKLTPLKSQGSNIKTSRASGLVYLGNDMLFLASHHGNSELFQVDMESYSLYSTQTLSNNAPVMDFAIMDMGNRDGNSRAGNAFASGQARIVAGCGAYHDGSLRSIRNGVGLVARGVLDELKESRGLFTLQSYGSDETDTLVVSFITETRVFRFDPEGNIEEVYTFQGMKLDTETLLATDLPNGQILQVTPLSVTILDPESGVALSDWSVSHGRTITRASANGKWALLSIDGSMLVSLNLYQDLAAHTQKAQMDPGLGQADQISCIHASHDAPDIGVVGWWFSGRITLIDLASLKPLHGEPMRQTDDSASVPRDIVLAQLRSPEHGGPTLLVGLENGDVVTFNVSTRGFAVSGRKSVTLGNGPVRLYVLPQDDGTCTVLATAEHASLIYSEEGGIVYSATPAEEVTCVAPFDSHAYPGSIFVSTENELRICQVDRRRLTHVKTLPVRETVRRLAYSPKLRAFGLGCIKKELLNHQEVVTSSFKLVDEIIFEKLGKPFILDGSSSLEVAECVIRAELPDGSGHTAERFIVGTSFLTDGQVEEANQFGGRILVLGVSEDRQSYQILSHNLRGPCRCLAVIDSHIVAALSKTIVVYSYTQETTSSGSLHKVAQYRPASFPIDLDVSGNTIGMIDLMQSLTLLEFTPPKDGLAARLEEQAQHHESMWSAAICNLDEGRWLEADAQGNIVVLQRNAEALEEQADPRMDVTSEINLGELVNQMRKLHVAPDETAIVHPRACLATTEGSVYLYGDISPGYQDLLLTLQSKLEPYAEVSGVVKFKTWRSFRSDTRESDAPYRFVDGEMIEIFLDMDEDKQELVCEGLGPSVVEMRNIVEALKRMH